MSIQPYSGTTSLKYILDETNKQINNITKLLSTGLKSDDTASSYLASNLNLDALDAANKAENAQNGLSFLQVAQKAYSDIVKELNTIANIANDVLSHNYTEDELQAKQDLITTSINKIKDIEANTKYGDINVFNNPNSAGSINQHMFAVTSQEITYTEETVDSSARGKDYSSYLANSVTRYTMSGLDTITGPSGETITLDENHIAIKTAEELVAALNTADTAGKTYYLMENIDLSSLGTLDDSLITETFQGTLEGNGYAISGLSIDSTNNRVGLFSTIGNGATIKNLVLKDFNIKGNEKVGALVGNTTAGNANTLDNISVINSTIQATTQQVGGIAGSLENPTTSLSNIIVQANVSAGTMYAGGIVGSYSQGNISNAAFSGNVTGESYLGGIAGVLNSPSGSIVQSYSMGTITQTKENTAAYTGGLVGHNRGIISNSYTTATISSATGATLVGALVGKNENTATIYNTYALGTGNGGEVALSTTQTGTVAGSTPTGMTEYTIDDITYAFASEDDKNAFVNQNGAIDSFYKFDTTTGSWIEMAQQLKNDSYQIDSVGDSIVAPNDTYIYLTEKDGYKYAFQSQEDLDNFVNNNYSTVISGYRLNNNGDVDNKWTYFDTENMLLKDVQRYTMLDENTILAADGTTIAVNSNNIVIRTAEEFRTALNNNSSRDQTYYLMNDIDLSSLGTLSESLITSGFMGTLEGNGYTISGLTIENDSITHNSLSNTNDIGLFERLSWGSQVRNLVLKDFNINVTNTSSGTYGTLGVGALAGYLQGYYNWDNILENISVIDTNITVNGDTHVDGLIGNLYKNNAQLWTVQVKDVLVQANITSNTPDQYVGGIIGKGGSHLTVSNSMAAVEGQLRGDIIGGCGGTQTNNSTIDNVWDVLITEDTTNTLDVVTMSSIAGIPKDGFSYLSNDGKLAFSSQEDRDKYDDATNSFSGTVETYYEKIGDNWVEKTVNAIYSDLEVSTTGTTTSQPRPSDFYQYTVERDGYIYAFYNESMMNNFINNNYSYYSSGLSGYRLDLNGDVDTEWVAFTTATGSGAGIQDRGKDYSAYLANSVDRYTKLNDTTIQAADGTTITLDDNHIAIYTAEEFVAALNVSDTAGKTYYLMENIDLSSLGTLDHALITETFQGTLEGNGYAISGLTIDAPESSSADNASLFNGIDNNAIIRNLILKDFNLNAYDAAALAGMVSGNAIIDNISIQNSNITASKGNAGGLVIDASSATFSNIIVNQTNISALNTSGGGTAGGILGTAWQTSISKVVFSGSVTGAYQAGGIIGEGTKRTTLSEAYSSGVITQTRTGPNYGSAGGLVGTTSTTDTVSNSYTDALVSGVDGAKVGALVGSNSGTLSDSYAINSTLAGVGNSNLTLGSASNTYVIRDDQSLDQTTYNIRYIGQDQVASGVLDFRDSTVWQNNENGKPTLLNAPSLSTLEISEEDLAELPGRVAQAGEIIEGSGIIYTKPNDTEANIYYGNYYFKTEEDKENFILYQQGLYTGEIEEFWKKTGANSWDVLTLSEQQVITSYSSSSTGNVITQSAAQGKPEYDVYYQDPTNITAPIYRFQTEEDRDAFIGFLSGNIPTSNISFLEKTSSGWQEKNLIVSGDEYETIVKANSVLTTPDGYNVTQGNITNSFEFDGDTYTIFGGYAFKNGTLDKKIFNNGSPTATIDKFFILQEDGSWQSASVNSVDGALTIQTTYQASFDASITYKGQTYYFYNNSYDKAFLNENDANKYNAEAGIFTGDVSSYIQIKDDGSFEEMRVTGQQTAEQDIIRQSTNESVSSVMYDYVSLADQANDTNRRYYTTVAKYISPGSNSESIIAITEDSAGKYIIDEDGFVQINPGETISIRFWDENIRSWGIAGTTGAVHGTASGIGLTIIPANLGDEYTQDITWNGFQIKAEEGLTFDENGPTQVGKSFYILENDGVTWTKYTSAYRMEYTPEKVADISNSISVPNSSYQKTTIDGKTYAFKSSEMISSLDNLSSVSNFYMLNEATMQWDFYTVSTSTSASSFEIVDGTDTVAASAVTTTGSMYAFASEEDRQAFNNGTLAGSSKYYEYDSANQNWKEYTVSQVSYSGLAFAGENTGTISTSFLVTGEASRNETIDGVTLLGNEQLANGLLGFNEPTIWQNNPNGLPTLITAPNTDKFNISDSSLGNLGSTTTFKENISYTTENIRFQGALTHDSFTFTTTADDKTLTLSELENKYISNIRIGSEGKVYTEGTDYIIYAEKSGDNITWKIDLMSDDIKGKELTFEYDYAHKDATQSTTGGFDIFLGENHKINISSLVLDLAGRLNFNVTSKDNAAATLTAIEGLRDYLDLKEWSLEADMSLVANALTNKNTQNSILNLAFNTIMSIDEALLQAELAAAELKRDTIQEFMSYFEKFNASTVTSLLYDPNSTQQTGDFTNLLLGRQSTGDENMDLLSSLVSSGAFNNSNNNEIMKLLSTYNNSNGYFYSNLYDYIQEQYKLA